MLLTALQVERSEGLFFMNKQPMKSTKYNGDFGLLAFALLYFLTYIRGCLDPFLFLLSFTVILEELTIISGYVVFSVVNRSFCVPTLTLRDCGPVVVCAVAFIFMLWRGMYPWWIDLFLVLFLLYLLMSFYGTFRGKLSDFLRF